ncbi:hypothetical protein [Comamonas testosteroni]|uniref:hypothetical protein n=1 Tax=Comamonas testosteroni TaxID=285 RepID=UPI0011EE9735|nr:hypothetical protein [Comamonas testosteroni]
MQRLSIKREALVPLFAKSGNVCAFPGCTHELVTTKNLFVGQVCHIEAAKPGGQRYNPNSTDEDRRSASNLILLCYRHHKETDDVVAFDADVLRSMKQQHESTHGRKPFKVDEAFLHTLEAEMQAYWSDVHQLNESRHIVPEFAVRLNIEANGLNQFVELTRAVERISEILGGFADSDSSLNNEIRSHLAALGYDLSRYDGVAYYCNPFFNRNWEIHSLAATNALTDLTVLLKRAEVSFLEEYVKTHSNQVELIERLASAKSELRELAISAVYFD